MWVDVYVDAHAIFHLHGHSHFYPELTLETVEERSAVLYSCCRGSSGRKQVSEQVLRWIHKINADTRTETFCLLLFSLTCALFQIKASVWGSWRHHSRNFRDSASRHAVSHKCSRNSAPCSFAMRACRQKGAHHTMCPSAWPLHSPSSQRIRSYPDPSLIAIGSLWWWFQWGFLLQRGLHCILKMDACAWLIL